MNFSFKPERTFNVKNLQSTIIDYNNYTKFFKKNIFPIILIVAYPRLDDTVYQEIILCLS